MKLDVMLRDYVCARSARARACEAHGYDCLWTVGSRRRATGFFSMSPSVLGLGPVRPSYVRRFQRVLAAKATI